MDLFDNPFFILRVGVRHTRQEIMDACEALALESEQDGYVKARAALTHPRNRITSEIAWLPGVPPEQALELADQVKSQPQQIGKILSQLPPLARCNLVAVLLSHHGVRNAGLISWLNFLATAYDEINVDQLLAAINQDREQAGFSPISSGESIETELSARRLYLANIMRDCLDKAENPDELMTAIVDSATRKGTAPAPALIDELVDKYQIEVQKYLDQLAEQIHTIREHIHSAPRHALDEKLALIEEKVRAWAKIARPIQVTMQTKGIDDDASSRLANQLRDTAILLANDHDLHAEASRISALMSDAFKDLPLFSQTVNEDIAALEKIIQRKKNGGVDPEWEKEISLDLAMGSIFKDKLSIRPDVIRFNRASLKTEEIDRVRWGVLVQYYNGIKTGSYYTIWIGSPGRTIKIECSKLFQRKETAEQNYQLILDKLWKAVGVRLVSKTLSRLAAGEKIRYGQIVVDKNGITLPRRKFLVGSEPYHAAWEELSISNGAGSFIIESTKEKKTQVRLAYRDVHNVPILESVLRFLWKDGNTERLRAGEFK